jgi:hypothetical protein
VNGLITTKIVVEHTANPGQLLSITDSVPYHRTGQTYFDRKTGKGYVYGYNGTGGALTANSFTSLGPYYTTDSTDKDWAYFTPTNIAVVAYIVAPCAAIPSTYFGWSQFKGNNTGFICTSESRATAGAHMYIYDGGTKCAAASAWGVPNTTFAVVRAADTGATTVANVRLIGREALSTVNAG